jgi:PAS domain-containing protein
VREKEYLRKDASRVPVLVARALFEWKPEEGVSFVIDMTDRKRAEERLRASEQRFLDAQMELAHVTRITTLGELAGSIAHEVNQPLAAVVPTPKPEFIHGCTARSKQRKRVRSNNALRSGCERQ